jgi:hypothetical protein
MTASHHTRPSLFNRKGTKLAGALVAGALLLGLGSGCAVRAHPPAIRATVRAPRAVVVHAPAPRVRVRRARWCYRRQCSQVCSVYSCWDRCRRVRYRCHR